MSTRFDRYQRRKAAAERAKSKSEASKPVSLSKKKRPTTDKKSANTADFHYFHNKKDSENCARDAARITKDCEDTDENKANSANALKKAKLSSESGIASNFIQKIKDALAKVDEQARISSGFKVNDKNRWMLNHCDGLWLKPGGQKGANGKEILNTKNFRETIEKDIQGFIDSQAKLEKDAFEKVFSFADDYMMSHWQDVVDDVEKKALRRAAFARFPGAATLMARIGTWEGLGRLVGNTIGAIVTNDMERQFQALLDKANVFSKAIEAGKTLLSKGGIEDAMASMMAGVAYANPCIKARKCLLVPFKDTGKTAAGNGCCPGQTGHHVIPNAMFNVFEPVTVKVPNKPDKTTMESQGLRKCWKNYSESNALTICLEGTANRAANGTHGFAHSGTEKIAEVYRHSPDMPYTQARDRISLLMAGMFGCDWKCIAEQLDDELKKRYSKDKDCGTFPESAMVSPHSGRGRGGPDVPIINPPRRAL